MLTSLSLFTEKQARALAGIVGVFIVGAMFLSMELGFKLWPFGVTIVIDCAVATGLAFAMYTNPNLRLDDKQGRSWGGLMAVLIVGAMLVSASMGLTFWPFVVISVFTGALLGLLAFAVYNHSRAKR